MEIIASILTIAFYSGTHSPQIAVTEDCVFQTYQQFLKRLKDKQRRRPGAGWKFEKLRAYPPSVIQNRTRSSEGLLGQRRKHP